MPKVKYRTDNQTQWRERKRFIRIQKANKKKWVQHHLSKEPTRLWLPHAPTLESFRDSFMSMQKSMYMSSNHKEVCYVCSENQNMVDLKKMNLVHHNQDDFHNLSTDIYINKPHSSVFPRVYSQVHQKDYHFHYLSKDGMSEFILVCQYCSRHLNRGTSIPKFSIPNYCFPESVPTCLESLTVAELLMVSRVFPRCIIYTLSESPTQYHRFLKGMLKIDC